MNGDKFISTGQRNYTGEKNVESDDNFFLHSEVDNMRSINQTEPIRHINDYDSNILQEEAYRDVKDELFKLEYKITKTEEELKEINKQIQSANEIYDYYQSDVLRKRKQILEEDLANLTEIYNEASISAKISSGINIKIRDKFLNAGKLISSFGEALVSKLPGKFASIIKIRNSLNKLENINKSVDELMKSRYPYGESEDKYEQLSRYIARANSIQADIYKFMK